jgi:LytS/YehU family sensor histidine kinase
MLFDSEKASQMITMLADFLRGSIQKDTSQMRSLEEELKHLKLYLAIEAIRFEERLNINVEVSETIQNAQLPALILQPLVENAIKYGLYGVVGKIELKIKIELDASFLVIQIVNPYDQSSSNIRKGTGFGLSSVARRLNLIYFRNDLLQIKDENGLFQVTLRIPQLNDTNNLS